MWLEQEHRGEGRGWEGKGWAGEHGLTQPRGPGSAPGERDGEAEAPIPAGPSAQPGSCGNGAPDDQCLQRCPPHASSSSSALILSSCPPHNHFLWTQWHTLPPLHACGLHTPPLVFACSTCLAISHILQSHHPCTLLHPFSDIPGMIICWWGEQCFQIDESSF